LDRKGGSGEEKESHQKGLEQREDKLTPLGSVSTWEKRPRGSGLTGFGGGAEKQAGYREVNGRGGTKGKEICKKGQN